MRTLVIHPQDETTAMLTLVYQGKDYTVISDPDIGKEELRAMIAAHDRVIMLGHGLPGGLINPKVKRTLRYADLFLIDDSFADLLRTKETVSVWCFSNEYFEKHRIPGFHTGMIISEPLEAKLMLDRCPLSKEELAENMVRFSEIVGECIEMTPNNMKEYILAKYVGEDEITKFNRKNIFVLA